MSVKIEFELGEEDLKRFRAMFDEARDVADNMDAAEVLAATRRLVEPAAARNPEGFIRSRIEGLGKLVEMVEDDTWKLPQEDKDRIVRALAYFVNPDDLIPDQTPGLGFLDDAIAAELVLRTLCEELEAYEEFVRFRAAEAERRRNRGLSVDISKEDWLADRRAALHSQYRRRRVEAPSGWTVAGLGF